MISKKKRSHDGTIGLSGFGFDAVFSVKSSGFGVQGKPFRLPGARLQGSGLQKVETPKLEHC